MEEITQKQNEISIMEIFRLLLSKLKYIILIVILGAGLGAGFGFLRTHNVEYYGTDIKFYINPSKDKGSSVNSDSQYGVYGAYGKNVLNNMVELLESEAFAEKLLLGEDGLPTEKTLASINNEKLYEKVAIAKIAVQKYNTQYENMENALSELNLANELVTKKSTELDKLLSVEGTEQAQIDNAKFELGQATLAQVEAQQKYDNFYKEVSGLSKKADEAKKPALELWRELDPTYRTNLNRITSSSKFSYYDETSKAQADDLARSFIYVNISVLNDKKYAEELRIKLMDAVEDYIIEKMPVPSGYAETNCIRISRTDEVVRTNGGVVKSTAIKYGLILGAASLIIACVVFIIVDRSDKRLRSVEQITDIFGVPVLGVIPTFKDTEKVEDDTQEEQTKEEAK